MKKVILALIIIVTSIAFSQENKEKNSIFNRKNEIKVGAIKFLAGPILEGTYEYIYTKDFTFGSSILINFDNESHYSEDFSITPFARMYFQETKEFGAKGFFAEGFVKYISGTYYPYSFYNEYSKKYNVPSIGISLGKKWINNSGFVLETLVGFGRNLGSSENAPSANFRGDLNFGYRF